jgi:hypothetical protein
MSFKVLEVVLWSIRNICILSIPFISFSLKSLAPLHLEKSPFDLKNCELICGELVNEQAYGDITYEIVLSVNTLTLNTWEEIFSDHCEFSG